jgi:hypothetical protein
LTPPAEVEAESGQHKSYKSSAAVAVVFHPRFYFLDSKSTFPLYKFADDKNNDSRNESSEWSLVEYGLLAKLVKVFGKQDW